MSLDRNAPPPWAKDAVATVNGWIDGDTGELLVSRKGLLDSAIEVEEVESEDITMEPVMEADTDVDFEVETVTISTDSDEVEAD